MNYSAITRAFLVLTLVAGSASAQNAPVQTARPALARLQPPVQAQPSSVSADEVPPVAPQVTCAGGQVTLSAENATLASVLHAVAGCAGATIDMPANIGVTRVFARLGPNQPTEIFSALLDGSLDYVIVGSSRNPARVHTVIVRPRQAEGGRINQSQTAFPQSPSTVAQTPVATFVDEQGVERLPSGLTPAEAQLSPEELAQKFEASRAEQRIDDGLPPPDPQ